jgi:lipoic acid synthetase
VGEAARAMGLSYIVVTAVNRDDLPDGGAGQFVATIAALRQAVPGARVEVLIPDFRGDAEALDAVFAARPDVLNHNVETVARLYDRVRPQAVYARSLDVLARARAAGLTTKSGFMLGLGEEDAEVQALLVDLRGRGVQIVTIGQYLRPSEHHHPVVRYVTPSEFARWRSVGLAMGFQAVQSAPLARSSYHARETSDQAAAAPTSS